MGWAERFSHYGRVFAFIYYQFNICFFFPISSHISMWIHCYLHRRLFILFSNFEIHKLQFAGNYKCCIWSLSWNLFYYNSLRFYRLQLLLMKIRSRVQTCCLSEDDSLIIWCFNNTYLWNSSACSTNAFIFMMFLSLGIYVERFTLLYLFPRHYLRSHPHDI